MKKSNLITGILVFIVSFIIYFLTASPSIGFWDSAEFASSNYNLLPTHPPGAPLYTMISAFLLSFCPTTKVSLFSNLISSLFGALTVVNIFYFTKGIAQTMISKKRLANENLIATFSGIIGCFSLAFCTSFWTIAIETEVYTLSLFLLSIVLRIGFRHTIINDPEKEYKLVLLIFLVLGFSTGVHLINLAVLIPICLLIAFKKHPKISLKNFMLSIGIGAALFLGLYHFMLQGFLKLATTLDVFLVQNNITTINNGPLILFLFFLLLLYLGQYLFQRKRKYLAHLICFSLFFFFLGSSSYLMPLIRSNATSNSSVGYTTKNTMDLLGYLKAKQFGVDKTPLLYGKTFSAPLDKDTPFTDGKKSLYYNYTTSNYIESNDGKYRNPEYAKEFYTFFPRMYSHNQANIQGYHEWTHIKGQIIPYRVRNTTQPIIKPTFKENIAFFINYQAYWSCFRYLLWNFSGRQNNNHADGGIKDGNWISGFSFIDSKNIGAKEMFPIYETDLNSRICFFMIPFFLGLIGLLGLLKYPKYFHTTLFFFITFGIGLIIYTNPLPTSILVRERDYIFIGSFMIFSVWIGLSLPVLLTLIKPLQRKHRVFIFSCILTLVSPIQMLAKNYAVQDKSTDTFPYDLAKMYLDSCPENTILITNGDNITFPLLYLQEVEKYRSDIKIINYDLLSLPWYISQLKTKGNLNSPIKTSIKPNNYEEGHEDFLPLQKQVEKIGLEKLFEFIENEHNDIVWNGVSQSFFPTDKFYVTVPNSKKNPASINNQMDNTIKTRDTISWDYSKSFYKKNDIAVLNIVMNNINDKPICFTDNGHKNHFIGLDSNLISSGLVKQLKAFKNTLSSFNKINLEKSLQLFTDGTFSSMLKNTDFDHFENRIFAKKILRKNLFLLAKALIDKGDYLNAKKVVDMSTTLIPNKFVLDKEISFSIGELYHTIGEHHKGNEICLEAINNLKKELDRYISFTPPNPIINSRKALSTKKTYEQMLKQFSLISPNTGNKLHKEHLLFIPKFELWYHKNHPY